MMELRQEKLILGTTHKIEINQKRLDALTMSNKTSRIRVLMSDSVNTKVRNERLKGCFVRNATAR